MSPYTLTLLGTVQGRRVLATGRHLYVLVLDGVLVLAPSTLDPIKGVTNKVPFRVDSVSKWLPNDKRLFS